MGKVKRNEIADYLSKKGDADSYSLMGHGFTALDETPGAQGDSVTYVNEVSASYSITGYETEFPFEAHMIIEESAVMDLYKVGRDHLTGSDAEFNYVRADLWDLVEGASPSVRARKFTVACEISDNNGEPGNPMSISGTLKAVGDPIQGTFNITTRAFVADDATTVIGG